MRWPAIVCVLLVIVLGGCAAKKVQPVSIGSSAPAWLTSLATDRIERDELIERLGRPSATFEAGRLVAYRLDGDYAVVSGWHDTRYNLILSFDADGTLVRHSVVRVK